MVECKHENADHLKPGDWWTCGQRLAPSLIQVEQFRCIDCGAWLPFGPATDDSFAVLDEIRAAEFVADKRNHKSLKHPRACMRGGRPACEVGGCDGCDVWDLARCIVEHKDSTP